MQKFLTGALAAVSTAALSVSTALASPAATLLRTEYERQQQALPLFERDHLIAEPGLLVIAILLAIYLVWKLRRDMRKRDEADRQYREMIAEAERLQASLTLHTKKSRPGGRSLTGTKSGLWATGTAAKRLGDTLRASCIVIVLA